jgi:hypothetical protein
VDQKQRADWIYLVCEQEQTTSHKDHGAG